MPANKKRLSKSEFASTLAGKTGLSKSQVTAVIDSMQKIIAQQLSKGGPGEVLLPGLLRLSVVEKPATRKHEGINPFTKEPMTFQAKPARRVIRFRALKALKDAI